MSGVDANTLLIQSPTSPPVTIPLGDNSRRRLLLGRSDRCDVVLADDRVSRKHAMLWRIGPETGKTGTHGDHWVIEDLGSRLGTFVGDTKLVPLRPVSLRVGDTVRVGPFTLSLRGAGAPEHIGHSDDPVGPDAVAALQMQLQRAWSPQRFDLLLEAATGIAAARTPAEAAAVVCDAALRVTEFNGAAIFPAHSRARPLAELCRPPGRCAPSASMLSRAAVGECVKFAPKVGFSAPVSIVRAALDAAVALPLSENAAAAAAPQHCAVLWLERRAEARPAGSHTSVNAPDADQDALSLLTALGRLFATRCRALEREEFERRHAELERKLEAARIVQEVLYPPPTLSAAGLTFVREMRAGAYISGDVLDVFPISDRALAVCIGDVTGHGPAAAVIMGLVQSFLRTALMQHPDPVRAVSSVNTLLAERLPSDRFVTAWVAVIDSIDRTVTYVDAGHGLWWTLHDDGARRWNGLAESEGGPVLGTSPESRYTTGRFTLPPGARLLLCTDGVIEQGRPDDPVAQFGFAGVEAAFAGPSGGQPDVPTLLAALAAHAGTRPYGDDVTVAMIC